MQTDKQEEIADISSEEEKTGEQDYKNSALTKCRFYRKKFPAKDDIVAVVTKDIKDLGAYVELLEYNNIEGFIMLSQVTNKRVKSVYKFLKIGKQEMMEVLRIDEGKECIDLTKKSIKPELHDAANKRFKKAKQVHGIMRQVAVKLQTPVEELYEQFGWDLYEKCGYDHAFDAFRVALS
jgi:translation initiation factor 2 subunit 1